MTTKKQQYDNQYYKDNKERINERRNTKYICSCGSNICKNQKSAHEKTKKHIKFLESQ